MFSMFSSCTERYKRRATASLNRISSVPGVLGFYSCGLHDAIETGKLARVKSAIEDDGWDVNADKIAAMNWFNSNANLFGEHGWNPELTLVEQAFQYCVIQGRADLVNGMLKFKKFFNPVRLNLPTYRLDDSKLDEPTKENFCKNFPAILETPSR